MGGRLDDVREEERGKTGVKITIGFPEKLAAKLKLKGWAEFGQPKEVLNAPPRLELSFEEQKELGA